VRDRVARARIRARGPLFAFGIRDLCRARDKRGKRHVFPRWLPATDCRGAAIGARLSANTKNKSVRSVRKMRRPDENTGDNVHLISYLPATVATLFVLAAGLLLGYIQ
jgi:hypothetical protein